MLRKLTIAILFLWLNASAFAEDYSMYNVGGYPMVQVTVNISNALDYAATPSYAPSYDYSSFYDYCSPSYSLYGMGYGTGMGMGMYGDSSLYSNPYTMGYDPSLSYFNPYMYGGSFMDPMWNYLPSSLFPSINPYTFPTPTNQTVYMNYPSSVPNIFNGTFPSPIMPSGSGIFTTPSSTNPLVGSSTLPYSNLPTGNPTPYGACDNIFVPCPMIPVNQLTQPNPGMPSFNPAPGQPIIPGNPTNPLAPTNHTGQIDPNSGRIGRGARTFYR